MTNDSEGHQPDENGNGLFDNIWVLMIAAIVMWFVYFALAHPPGGAPFIYAEF